jgi:hypothetical protein
MFLGLFELLWELIFNIFSGSRPKKSSDLQLVLTESDFIDRGLCHVVAPQTSINKLS